MMYVTNIIEKNGLRIVEICNRRYVKCEVYSGGYLTPLTTEFVYHEILNDELKKVGWWMNRKIQRMVKRYYDQQNRDNIPSINEVVREKIIRQLKS